MIKKEESIYKKIFLGVVILSFFSVLVWYRQVFVDAFWSSYIRYMNFSNISANTVSLSEKEELEKLRVENISLKNSLEDLKNEINLMEDGLEPTYVKLLGGNLMTNLVADYYGSFYVSYPKDKTVYKGMNVYAHGNVIVGVVEEVFKNSLFVTRLGQNKTFLAESSEVDEQIELSSLGDGLYVGTVAAGSKISVGDQIVLKGYPKAVVGMLSEIVKNEGTLSTAFVRAPYNIYKKEIFYVLQ